MSSPKAVLSTFVDKNTEKGDGLVVRIQLELGVNLDDECGGDDENRPVCDPR